MWKWKRRGGGGQGGGRGEGGGFNGNRMGRSSFMSGISESLLRVDMKVVLTVASKGHPGCTGVHQEKGSPLWKTPSTFNWIGKNGCENGW